MRILHVFNNHENMQWFIRNNVDHYMTLKDKELTLQSPSGVLMFRVISNMKDCMNIAGHEISCAIWHYPADEDIRKYVLSRIRYLK
jgi:hypothetical protein